MSTNEIPDNVKAWLEEFAPNAMPTIESERRQPRGLKETQERCGDCRKAHDKELLIVYGNVKVCRRCGAARDRKNGWLVRDGDWA